jgi:hypothetical protein
MQMTEGEKFEVVSTLAGRRFGGVKSSARERKAASDE